MERVSLGYRRDRGRNGWALNAPYFRVGRLDGWIGARYNMLFEDKPITRDRFNGTPLQDLLRTDGAVQFDLFYTPVAGRLVDWYVSGGLDRGPSGKPSSAISSTTRPSPRPKVGCAFGFRFLTA